MAICRALSAAKQTRKFLRPWALGLMQRCAKGSMWKIKHATNERPYSRADDSEAL